MPGVSNVHFTSKTACADVLDQRIRSGDRNLFLEFVQSGRNYFWPVVQSLNYKWFFNSAHFVLPNLHHTHLHS